MEYTKEEKRTDSTTGRFFTLHGKRIKQSTIMRGVLFVTLLFLVLLLIALWYQSRPQNEDDRVRAFLVEQLIGLDVLVESSAVDAEFALEDVASLSAEALSVDDQNRLLSELNSLR